MSRVRFPNRLGGAVLLLLTAAGLSACGPNVHSATVRGVGYVRMDEVVKHDPLYPQLAQLDDAIAAINLEAAGPHVPLSAQQIAAQTKVLNRELQQAQDRANAIIAQKQTDYAKREGQAVAAALTAAGVSGAGAYAAAQMSATSATQARGALQAANQDFMNYQQSVIGQSNAASSAIARQLQVQAAQKVRAKAEQLQQNETDLSLKLTQQDAASRLSIKMRLSNLALDTATRDKLQAQMSAINTREANAAAAARQRDAATLAAYQKQVGDETRAAIANAVGSVNTQTRLKLEERRNEVGAQIRSLGPPALPPNLPANVKAQIAQIHQRFTKQFQADAQKAVGDYASTKADLDRQFAALHGADVGATGAAAVALTKLQKQRTDLYAQIVTQIRGEADRLAKAQGLTTVFTDITAAPGGYDMTNELIKDIESLHE